MEDGVVSFQAMAWAANPEQQKGAGEEVAYQTCEHCGFRLLHVLPPTRKTFPFPVLFCPICGFRQDDSGLHPGQTLSREEKFAALRRWLSRQGLDEQTLARHYHLELAQFFEEVASEA